MVLSVGGQCAGGSRGTQAGNGAGREGVFVAGHGGLYVCAAITTLAAMRIESLHVGMKVRHPQYGVGTVKTISEHTAEVRFEDSVRTVEPNAAGLEPAEPQVSVTGLQEPLTLFIQQTAAAVVQALGLEKPESFSGQLAPRWHNGKIVMHPADATLQTKEVPLDGFFHKIVMMRNNLRVLEQKVNAHEKLSDAEKVEMQQYITRCYGSMTTFNVLFRNKEDQFNS